jgi:hypothetical protein
MVDKIIELKTLNAAYIAALQYDYCPEPKEAKKVAKNFETGVSIDNLQRAFLDNQGRRPDEIAHQISDLIKELPS